MIGSPSFLWAQYKVWNFEWLIQSSYVIESVALTPNNSQKSWVNISVGLANFGEKEACNNVKTVKRKLFYHLRKYWAYYFQSTRNKPWPRFDSADSTWYWSSETTAQTPKQNREITRCCCLKENTSISKDVVVTKRDITHIHSR